MFVVLFKLLFKNLKKEFLKKRVNMLQCLKKKSQSVVSNVACINLKNGGRFGTNVFWNARAAFSGISWPLSPLETKMVLN